jgi:hypothetical protein
VSLADTLYNFDSFRATFAASALPGVTLSDKDLRVLLKFLERDRRAVVTEGEVRFMYVAVRARRSLFTGDQILRDWFWHTRGDSGRSWSSRTQVRCCKFDSTD